jgi:hypothetical protein
MADAAPTPIINPNLPFTVWNRTEIYDPVGNPNNTTAVYVPNVNDLVIDYNQGFFIVSAVDYTTGISTLEAWNLPLSPGANDNENVLLGAGPGTIADSYRCFINSNTKPATLALDKRLRIYGSTTTSCAIFIGTDISETGNIISQYYDSNWNLLGSQIPLEVVATTNINNSAIKAPMVGYTTATLTDGELLTVVTYDDVGTVVSTAKVIAQNTNFIRTTNASLKYIKSIALDAGPFQNPSNPQNILYPINMPVANLGLMGVVTYSDGTTVTLPVDGTKFKIFGLENFLATQQGQTIPLVLVYSLSADEYNYIGAPNSSNTITEEYSATTAPTDGAYSVKMFIYPVWVSPTAGYRLQFYLYDLDRQDVYDVTNLVEAGGTGPAFQPTLYNTQQNLSFAVQMNQVDSSYAAYRFVQTIGISLLRLGNDQSGDNWWVQFSPGQNPQYGVGVKAAATYVEVNNWNVDLTCGQTDFSTWLNQVFYATQPLFDPASEVQAPQPNIMVLYVDGTPYEFPITQWNTPFSILQTLTEGDDIFVEWIYRDGQNDQQLGVSGFIIHLTGVPVTPSPSPTPTPTPTPSPG